MFVSYSLKHQFVLIYPLNLDNLPIILLAGQLTFIVFL